MIRQIFITLLFFFGPALLMMLLRNVFLFWQFKRQRRRQQPDVIDITPKHQAGSPSRFFLASVLTVGLIFAWLAWSQMYQESSVQHMQYVPAHLDQHGQLVDGHYVPK